MHPWKSIIIVLTYKEEEKAILNIKVCKIVNRHVVWCSECFLLSLWVIVLYWNLREWSKYFHFCVFNLVFLFSGVSYEASYQASFASVLYDFALSESNKTNTNKVSYKASYETTLTRKIRLMLNIWLNLTYKLYLEK